MNTVENNKIIAEFLGFQNTNSGWYDYEDVLCDFESDNTFDVEDLKFDKDWNWLMPVIDKLKEVWEEPEELDNLKDALWWDNIRGVYEMAVELIKEYNQQKN